MAVPLWGDEGWSGQWWLELCWGEEEQGQGLGTVCLCRAPSAASLLLQVLGQSRRSSLSGCQQCFSVTSSVLLSLFVSPIITAVTVGKCTRTALRALPTCWRAWGQCIGAIAVEHLGGVSDAQGSLGFPCGEGQLGLLLRARQ